MFEKIAEKYARDTAIYYESTHGKVPSQFEKYLCKAVEYGFRKANKWHYVKDGDLPKDDKPVLVYREDEEPQLDYYFNEEGYWKSEKWDREYYARKGENPPVSSIIAWKEIVLPEE